MKILPSPLPVSQSVGMRQPKFHNIEVTKLGGSSMRKLPLVILGLILSLAASPAVGHEKFRIAVGGNVLGDRRFRGIAQRDQINDPLRIGEVQDRGDFFGQKRTQPAAADPALLMEFFIMVLARAGL